MSLWLSHAFITRNLIKGGGSPCTSCFKKNKKNPSINEQQLSFYARCTELESNIEQMASYWRDFTTILYNLGYQYQLSAWFAVSAHHIININGIVSIDRHICHKYSLTNSTHIGYVGGKHNTHWACVKVKVKVQNTNFIIWASKSILMAEQNTGHTYP